MGYIATAQTPTQEANLARIRKHKGFPDTAGEPTRDYVCTVKPDSPIESLTLLGIDFHKRVFPKAMGYRENEGKYFEPGVIARPLTEKQVTALRDRAEETDIAWTDRNGIRHQGRASDIMVLVEKEKYNPMVISQVRAGEQPQHPKDLEVAAEAAKKKEQELEPANIKEQLYEAQRKRK